MLFKWPGPNESPATVARERKRSRISKPLFYNAINLNDQGKFLARELELIARLVRLVKVKLNLFLRLKLTYLPYLFFRLFLMISNGSI